MVRKLIIFQGGAYWSHGHTVLSTHTMLALLTPTTLLLALAFMVLLTNQTTYAAHAQLSAHALLILHAPSTHSIPVPAPHHPSPGPSLHGPHRKPDSACAAHTVWSLYHYAKIYF